jgi:hypothetical protein
MKGDVVYLNRARWLGLANAAMDAAGSLDPKKAKDLAETAGSMQAATPPATDKVAMTGCLAFRWACQHFGFVTPAARPALAAGLIVYATEIRRIFEYAAPPPEAVSMPVPRQAELLDDAEPPRWTARADIGG